MRTSKLRQRVFSVTGMVRAIWVCIWRRSKLKLNPTGCHAIVSSRQTISTTEPMIVPRPVVTAVQIEDARHVVNSIYIDDKVRNYIVDLVLATRPPIAASLKLDGYIQNGASPRATIALTLGARAMAFLQGRHFVIPQDVKAVALDVLRHRVSVTYEAEAESVSSENVIEKILNTLPVP